MQTQIHLVSPTAAQVVAKTDPVPALNPQTTTPSGTTFREILDQLDKSHRDIMVNPLHESVGVTAATDTKTLIGYQIQVSKYSLHLEMCSRVAEGLTSTTKKLQGS